MDAGECVQELAKDKDSSVRQAMAENPSTPAKVLELLALDEDKHVRIKVAENASTPPTRLELMALEPAVNDDDRVKVEAVWTSRSKTATLRAELLTDLYAKQTISFAADDKSGILTLPDKSVVKLDKTTLQFHSIEPATATVFPPRAINDTYSEPDFRELVARLQKPNLLFGNCFRRISDHPRYSPKHLGEWFDLRSLTQIYNFQGETRNVMFTPLNRKWFLLDGFIESQSGYGFGSHSWTVVQGAEALRAICLFFGIKQPRTIGGEPPRRALSLLRQDLTGEQVSEQSKADREKGAMELLRPGEPPLGGLTSTEEK